jgi:phosphate transport system permease protein
MGAAQVTRRRFGFGPQKAGPRNRNDQRAELLLGALACVVLALIAGMIIFVFQKAWPSFSHNGLAWFGSSGNVDLQLEAIFRSPAEPSEYVYHLRAWPLLYATALITGFAVLISTAIALLSAMFIVEFAPDALRKVLEPVVRLLAAVPSVIYGLIGILVIVPFVGNNLITESAKISVAGVISLNGSSVGVGVLILTVMITPIMIAIVVDALRAVPRDWNDGAVALGINRFRALWTVGVRAARPAIVAAAVLATARALGEAIMLIMVTGSVAFAPNPADGFIFFVEPALPLAPAIIKNAEGLSVEPLAQTLYAFAAVLLVAAAFMSFTGWYIRRTLRRYTLSPI